MADLNQLISDIQDWMARTDVPTTTFISMAESEMNRILRLQSMEQTDSFTGLVPDADGVYNIPFPTGFLDAIVVENGGIPQEYVTNREFIVQNETDSNNWTWRANVYTIQDENIKTFSGPDVDVTYRKAFTPLSLTNLTNWFTDNAYDALLYLCLDHGTTYSAENNPTYRQKAVERLVEIQNKDDQSRYSGAPLVMRG